MDEGSPVDIIYLDFQKAFDKVPHQRLILKLKSHGIGISIIKWIEQWLTDRRQRVVVDKTTVKCRWGGFKLETSFEWGTTRISTRSYILFLIYINDLIG